MIISKVYPEITDHPLSDMLASGLIVSLGSDDPALLGYDLADEYQTVLEVGLVDADGLRRIALDGVTACWLPDDDKARLRRRVEPAWAAATGLGAHAPMSYGRLDRRRAGRMPQPSVTIGPSSQHSGKSGQGP